jgi:hypothetical protein
MIAVVVHIVDMDYKPFVVVVVVVESIDSSEITFFRKFFKKIKRLI